MKKFILKKYDDGKIRFFKLFNSEEELLKFANDLIGSSDTVIKGPFEEKDKIVYSVDIKWVFHHKQ